MPRRKPKPTVDGAQVLRDVFAREHRTAIKFLDESRNEMEKTMSDAKMRDLQIKFNVNIWRMCEH